MEKEDAIRARTAGAEGRVQTWTVAWLLIALAGLAGCVDLDPVAEVQPSSLWEATISPFSIPPGSPLPLVSGQAAVVVRSANSLVGLSVEGVDRDLAWGIFEQSCEAPGEPLLAADRYPLLTEDPTELEIVLPTRLSKGESYNIRILLEAEDRTVACGDFQLVDQ